MLQYSEMTCQFLLLHSTQARPSRLVLTRMGFNCLRCISLEVVFAVEIGIMDHEFNDVLTPAFCVAENMIKMASNEKVSNIKNHHVVEMNNFDVWVVTIRSHIEGEIVLEMSKFSIQSTIWPITPRRQPLMMEFSTWIVLSPRYNLFRYGIHLVCKS